MTLEAKYQYTHFIYPFIIKDKKYKDFLKTILIKESQWTFNFDEYFKDESLYGFFLPYMRKFLFPTLFLSKDDIRNFKSLSLNKKASLLSNTSCISFEYNLSNIKTGHVSGREYNAINFDISSIRLICFQSGICFLDIKTQVDEDKDYIEFSKILDFNHFFRLLTPKVISSNINNVNIKGKNIDKIANISLFINSVMSGFEDNDIEKIFYDKMFTYTYVCIDQKYWSNYEDFEKIKNDFFKLQYVIDGKNSSEFSKYNEQLNENMYSRWQYSTFGFSNESGVLFVSDKDRYNITTMPYDFERTYMYMLYLALYQKISLINFSQALLQSDKTMIKTLNKKLTDFTHYTWFNQITNSEHGNDIWNKWKKAFKLEELYDEVHKEYMEYYSQIRASNQEKINLMLITLSITSLIISGISIVYRSLNVSSKLLEDIVTYLILMVACMYPLFLIIRKILYKLEKKVKRGY